MRSFKVKLFRSSSQYDFKFVQSYEKYFAFEEIMQKFGLSFTLKQESFFIHLKAKMLF